MFIKGLKFLTFIAFTCITLASCQKEIDFTDPDIEIPPGVLDSTLLIKSLEGVWGIGTPEMDSSLLTFNYDTVNRKINITFSAPHADPDYSAFPDGTVIVHSYNDKGLLSHVVYNYPSGYIPYDYDYKTVDIVYDADKIVKSITYKNGIDVTKQVSFTKTALAAGNYKLSWLLSGGNFEPDESYLRSAVFTADGRNTISSSERFSREEVAPSQFEVIKSWVEIDSFLYDANGSVTKVYKKQEDLLDNTVNEYLAYDFKTRYTKGNQMYELRQTLLNGVANMPFEDLDEFGLIWSAELSYESFQFSKYPIQQVTMKLYDNSFGTFNFSSSFDSKDRLTVFRGFFNDYEIYPELYKITYYK